MAQLKREISFAVAAALFGAGLPAFAQEPAPQAPAAQPPPAQGAPTPAADASATSATLTRRVRLRPVVRDSAPVVRLKPILKDDPASASVRPADAATTATIAAPLAPAPAPAAEAAAPGAGPGETPEVSPAALAAADAAPAAEPNPILAEKISQARALLEAGDAEGGRRMLLELAAEAPNSAEAPAALWLAAEPLKDLTEARAELRRLVVAHPRSPEAKQALARIGEVSFILGDFEDSAKAYRAYASLESDPALAHQAEVQMTLALLRSGKFEEARAGFEGLRAKDPGAAENPALLEAEAETLLALDRAGEADKILEAIETRYPNYEHAAKALFGRGLCAELGGRSAAARAFYERVTADYPQTIEAALAGARLADLARPIVE